MELFLTLRQQFVFNSDFERGTEPLSSEWPKRGSEHGGNPPPYRSASQIRELSAPKGPYRDMAIGSVRCVEASSRYPQKKKSIRKGALLLVAYGHTAEISALLESALYVLQSSA